MIKITISFLMFIKIRLVSNSLAYMAIIGYFCSLWATRYAKNFARYATCRLLDMLLTQLDSNFKKLLKGLDSF